MKNNKINDERIIFQRKTIYSDAYQILIYSLLISILIQQFILKAPFSQFMAEFICLITIWIYTTIRHLCIGMDIYEPHHSSNKNLVINSLSTGAICILIFVVLTGEKNFLTIFLTFISLVCIHFIFQIILKQINKKRQNQIDISLSKIESENIE